MADEADLAAEYQEQAIERSLEQARRQATEQAPFTGRCLYCDEDLEPEPGMTIQKRWCDDFCRDQWEKAEALRKRLGGINGGTNVGAM